jgi:hypothetical protein
MTIVYYLCGKEYTVNKGIFEIKPLNKNFDLNSLDKEKYSIVHLYKNYYPDSYKEFGWLPSQLPVVKCPGYGLVELLSDKGKILGVEIGCDKAVTTEFLVRSLPELELHSIDPYCEYVDWNGVPVHENTDAYNLSVAKMEPYKDRFTLHRKLSSECVSNFEDGSLDFIFIDGIHTYDGVKEDCLNYYSKVKPGGLFAGHDFSVIPAVNRAVKEFASSVNKEIFTTDVDVWYWYK